MAILDKIRLSGTTYDIIDATAIHSLDGYWTTGETTAAITAATNALAESIAEQGYQTSGDVQNAISGKADADDVYTKQETSDLIDEKIAEASGVTTGEVQTMIDEAVSGKADTTAVTEAISEAVSGKLDTSIFQTYSGNTETVLASKFAGATWSSNDKKIYFYDNASATGTALAYIDGTDFVKDGFLSSVTIDNRTISGESVPCLVFIWNTDAGIQETDIPISGIFDPTNYVSIDTFTAYTAATDTALAGKANTGDVVTDVYGSVQEVEGQIILQVSKTKGNHGNNVVRVNFDTSGFTWDSQNNFLDINTNNIATTGYVASATSGKADSSTVDSLSGTVTAHTANTDIHVTTADKTAWSGKQDALVSGTNIKTINGASILGAGDITTLQVEVSGTTLVFS